MRTGAWIALAALAAFIAYSLRQGRAARETRAAERDDLRRWEGDGGAAVAVPRPASGMYHEGDPSVRH